MPSQFYHTDQQAAGVKQFKKTEASLLAKIRKTNPRYSPCAFYYSGTQQEKIKYLEDYDKYYAIIDRQGAKL